MIAQALKAPLFEAEKEAVNIQGGAWHYTHLIGVSNMIPLVEAVFWCYLSFWGIANRYR